MSAFHGWLIDARSCWVVLWAWLAVVLLYGLARSSGQAKLDPVRDSGPFDTSR